MSKVAREPNGPEVQASLEGSIPGHYVPAEKLGPHQGFCGACPIISTASTRELRGLLGIEFVCPTCHSRRYGTNGLFGVCQRVTVDELEDGPGWTISKRCTFEWLRSDDWTVFRVAGTGRPFTSREEFEAFVKARL